MKSYTKAIATLCAGSLLAQPLILAGCAAGSAGSVMQEPTTEAKTFTVTTISFATKAKLRVFAEDEKTPVNVNGKEMYLPFPGNPEERKDLQKRLLQRLESEDDVAGTQRSGIVVLVAVWLAEQVIDAIVKEMKKRAAEYTAEYAVTNSGILVAKDSKTLAFDGIIVRRDRFTQVKGEDPKHVENEMCLVYRLAEVPRKEVGTGLFDATPIFLRIAKPVARTSTFDDGMERVTVTAKLTLEPVSATSKSGTLDYAFIATRLPVGKNAVTLVDISELNRKSGLFALPVGAVAPTGVNVKITLTEVDQGYDAKILEAVAGAIDKNKTQIVDVVKKALPSEP